MSHTLTKVILIDLIHPRMSKEQSLDRLQELEELVRTYGGMVIVKTYQKRFAPHPRTFIGSGKVEELAKEGKISGATLIIINDRLKPRQIYTISEMLRPSGIRVWDRLDLILKIFSKHAKTTEARLEIELAAIRHMGPRIFGMGMELSRQAGGIGTRGIGETNTEIMKRHLKEQERKVQERLDKYRSVRQVHRAGRRRKDLKTVAIVGYTNAGKTTLLNTLTHRREYTADELFATLDTRVGTLYLPSIARSILVSDTIGFVKQLPTELLNAFESTLSEAIDADLLFHVVDAADPHWSQHVRVVEEILGRLGVSDKPRVVLMNKSDILTEEQRHKVEQEARYLDTLWISAATGKGIDQLIERIASRLK